jgi:hypothetical protein
MAPNRSAGVFDCFPLGQRALCMPYNSTLFSFEAKEENRLKKRRKDFCVMVKKINRRRLHFQNASFAAFLFCRPQFEHRANRSPGVRHEVRPDHFEVCALLLYGEGAAFDFELDRFSLAC